MVGIFKPIIADDGEIILKYVRTAISNPEKYHDVMFNMDMCTIEDITKTINDKNI
jgi:hypothetical protein